jgi:hypothetical protein
MSQAEHPERLERPVTVDDVRQLMGASTPHFALQIRNRIARLIAHLPADDQARLLGEAEIRRLTQLGVSGEVRGHHAEEGMRPMPSNSAAILAGAGEHEAVGGFTDEVVEPSTSEGTAAG